ncbi:STAS domain-containing protein [Synechocystis sp. PCC 7509]|uniref:STAS domain-containing protein n=1 Tax=Synechocystis sp. PCC 7509 TaxID=927677 RepID=UPI0002ACABDE|nr:STAS domain-containing protein [Synechocystis sp. PCC 7509]
MSTTIAYPEITVICPYGAINASNSVDFQQEMARAIAQNQKSNVLVNLKEVESLDSAGLMALVSSLRLAQTLGSRFSLCGVSPSIRIIFELTQLDRVFEIFENTTAFEKACS